MQEPAPSLSRSSDTGIGEELYRLAAEIFPICRSITGDGVRQTLDILRRHAPFEVVEVATGTRVLDWDVPQEWTIREAFIADPAGRRIVDLANQTLSVVSYSVPVRARLPLAELKRHVHTLPEQPHLVPYRTSYYAPTWGFCMSHAQLEGLPDGDYEVVIDSELKPGSLTYGELYLPGTSEDEVLVTAHICHPSLANDNCSGLALATLLARDLAARPRRLSTRVLLSPGTIGPITWLARNRERVGRIRHGLVLSCVGDAGGPTYKKSRRGDALVDRAMAHVLRHLAPTAEILDFTPYGYDERQFCSPGFNLPVGLFQRSRHGSFAEYHTSADDLDFIAPEPLAQSYRIVRATLDIIEGDCRPRNLSPYGEPQLGRRGLYASVGGGKTAPDAVMAMLWVLNLADGHHTLLDMAERAGLAYAAIRAAALRLEGAGLLELDAD
ncbi:MAG: DUF4910 domain-containing protein [Hyphomicrobiaceae bacterium]